MKRVVVSDPRYRDDAEIVRLRREMLRIFGQPTWPNGPFLSLHDPARP